MTLLITFLNCFLEQLIARWSEANHPPSQWLAVVTVVLCYAQTKELTSVNAPRSSSVMTRVVFAGGVFKSSIGEQSARSASQPGTSAQSVQSK